MDITRFEYSNAMHLMLHFNFMHVDLDLVANVNASWSRYHMYIGYYQSFHLSVHNLLFHKNTEFIT
jgi:hypothetical protein